MNQNSSCSSMSNGIFLVVSSGKPARISNRTCAPKIDLISCMPRVCLLLPSFIMLAMSFRYSYSGCVMLTLLLLFIWQLHYVYAVLGQKIQCLFIPPVIDVM